MKVDKFTAVVEFCVVPNPAHDIATICELPSEAVVKNELERLLKTPMAAAMMVYDRTIISLQTAVRSYQVEVMDIVPEPPAAVRAALEHVRGFLPKVDRVTFTPEGSWEYSQNGDAPEFWHEDISADVLRAAWDAVKGPAVFFVVEG